MKNIKNIAKNLVIYSLLLVGLTQAAMSAGSFAEQFIISDTSGEIVDVVDNGLDTSSRDFFLEVSRGNRPGMRGFSIPGRKDSIGTTNLEDITETGNTVLPRPAGADLDIVSANGNDTAAGTGVQELHIEYLDSSGDEQTLVVATNGGTVNVGTSIYDVNWIHATAVGANTVAVGDITLVDNATGAIVYEQISAGGNQSLSARFKIPADTTGYLIGWQASAITRKIDIRVRADIDRFDRSLQTGVFNFQDVIVLEQAPSGWIPIATPLKLPALSTIKMSGISFTGAGDGSGQFDIILIDD